MSLLDEAAPFADPVQIDAQRVVFVCLDGDFQLGSHTIGRGDQQRILVAGRLGVEDAAEAAQPAGYASPAGRGGERADGIDQRVARGDVDAGFFIGQ